MTSLADCFHLVETGQFDRLPEQVEQRGFPNLLMLFQPSKAPFCHIWRSPSFPHVDLSPTPVNWIPEHFPNPDYMVFPVKHKDLLLGWWVFQQPPPHPDFASLIFTLASAWRLHVEEILSQNISYLTQSLEDLLQEVQDHDLTFPDFIRTFLRKLEARCHGTRAYYLQILGSSTLSIHSATQQWQEVSKVPLDFPDSPVMIYKGEFYRHFPPTLQDRLASDNTYGWYLLPIRSTPHKETLVLSFTHVPHPLTLDHCRDIQQKLAWARLVLQEREQTLLHNTQLHHVLSLAHSLKDVQEEQKFLTHLLDLLQPLCQTTTAAGVLLENNDPGKVRVVVGRGMWRELVGKTFSRYEGLIGHALNERRIVLSTHYEEDTRLAGSPYVRGLTYGLAIPLLLPSGEPFGVVVFGSKTPMVCTDDLAYLQVLTKVAMSLYDRVKKDQELLCSYRDTLNLLMKTLAIREHGTHAHTARVTSLTLALGKELNVSGDELLILYWGAMLHDIGKIGIPDHILQKAGPLSEEEWEVMRRHPLMGKTILQDLRFLREALDIVVYHHERFDGKGYPYGLKGEAIPRLARIFSVVDAFDAMISDRPYRKGMLMERALEEIARNRGTQFDPDIADRFIELIHKRPDLVNHPQRIFEELPPSFRFFQLFAYLI